MKKLIKQILKEQTKSVTCECGWSWKLSEGGDDPYVCHKCGKDNSKKYLKESVDNRIVDVLVKLNLNDYKKIKEFLEESGYDVDEIEEIYSNYFESISGLELSPPNWMNFYFSPDQLEVVNDDYDLHYKDSIFFRKNGKVVMEQDDGEKQFWFDYDDIWSFFELYYGMEYDHVYNFLGFWLKDTLKLNRYNPIRKAQLPPIWKRLSN